MKTYAFIDASNLFYGGEKILGWKIDYEKLFGYMREKYAVDRVLYFGGIDIHTFPYDYQSHDTVPIDAVYAFLKEYLKMSEKRMNDAEIILIGRHLARIGFYKKLDSFGYELFLKPVKRYEQEDGSVKHKANVDVEMAFALMREQESFDRLLICSGDGDFLPVLKYLRDEKGKEILVLARGKRTAKEIKQFAAYNFVILHHCNIGSRLLRNKEERHPMKDAVHV